MTRKLNNVIGESFFDVTIIANADYRPNTPRKVLVQCVCRNQKVVTLSDLRAGYIKSCGCKKTANTKTHGMTKTPLYRVWVNMKSRCLNPNAQFYSEYGGRGITIYSKWLEFEAFQKWALNNGYVPELTLDRRNNNRGYSPSNCRWVTRKVNQANRRSVKNSSSKFVGVTYIPDCSNNPWLASLKVDGKTVRVGVYPAEDEAALARNAYVIKHNLPHTINVV